MANLVLLNWIPPRTFWATFCSACSRAPDKWRYLRTWGWIDLLSSIPAIDALRVGRAGRLVRIIRVLRAMKSVRAIAHYVMVYRKQTGTLAAVFMTFVVLVFSSVAVLQFEPPMGGNIVSAEDALWWSISTMTTVGYGDRYPVSSEGRLVAVLLMAAGVGLFSTFSGLVASWFLTPEARERDEDIAKIVKMLEALGQEPTRFSVPVVVEAQLAIESTVLPLPQ